MLLAGMQLQDAFERLSRGGSVAEAQLPETVGEQVVLVEGRERGCMRKSIEPGFRPLARSAARARSCRGCEIDLADLRVDCGKVRAVDEIVVQFRQER